MAASDREDVKFFSSLVSLFIGKCGAQEKVRPAKEEGIRLGRANKNGE